MAKRKFIYGAILGAAAAGITVLLTPPVSGKERKIKLAEQKDEWLARWNEIKSDLTQLKNSIIDLSQAGKEEILPLIKEIKDLVQEWQKEIGPHQEQIEKEIKSIQQTISELEKLQLGPKDQN